MGKGCSAPTSATPITRSNLKEAILKWAEGALPHERDTPPQRPFLLKREIASEAAPPCNHNDAQAACPPEQGIAPVGIQLR